MTIRHTLLASMLLGTVPAQADTGRWSFSCGPSWRARVKMSIRGSSTVPTPAATHATTVDRDVSAQDSWALGDTVMVEDPQTPGYDLYAVEVTRTESTLTPRGNSAILDADRDRPPLGFRSALGCSLLETERISLGLGLSFAAYWNLRCAASATAGGGTLRVRTTKDYHLFEDGPYPNDTDFSYARPSADPYLPYRRQTDSLQEAAPRSRVSARLESDLYQIGLGPALSWRVLDRVTINAGTEGLCNLVVLDFDTTGGSCAETLCRLGFAGRVGGSVSLTEHLGLYAEVGYEWVDKAKASSNHLHGSVDFSSLTVSTGLMATF